MNLFVFIVVLFLGLVLAAGSACALLLLGTSLYYCVLKGKPLEKDLGFRYGSASLPYRSLTGYISAVAIISLDEGGVFQRAGFRVGDVLPDVSVIGLFRLLHSRRGQVVELSVADGGSGPPFLMRPRRIIRFFVPRKATKDSPLDS